MLTETELDELMSRPDEPVIACVDRHPGSFAVLGAGGKMGFHFCQMLARSLAELGRSEKVTAVSRFRSVRSREAFEHAGCDVVTADLSRPDEVAALAQAENVFYLAGVKFGTAAEPSLLHTMNVEMPRLIGSHFRDSKIVALSTGCVYSFATPESGGSTEDDPLDPPGAYARSCIGREEAFTEAAERFGTRSTLIRLNYAIDLRYGVLVDLATKVLNDQPIDLTTGYVNVIWQGDAVRHCIRSLDLASAPPTALNITGPSVHSVRELATRLGDAMGRTARFVGQPSETAWLSNAARSHSLFGVPETDIERMIAMVARWVSGGGASLGKPTHFEKRDGAY